MMYSQFAKDVANRVMKGEHVKVLIDNKEIFEVKSLATLESLNRTYTLTSPNISLGELILPEPYNAYLHHKDTNSSVELFFNAAEDAEKFYYAVTHTMRRI